MQILVSLSIASISSLAQTSSVFSLPKCASFIASVQCPNYLAINSLCSCTELTKISSTLSQYCDGPDQISVTEFFSSCLNTATTLLPSGFSTYILYEKLMIAFSSNSKSAFSLPHCASLIASVQCPNYLAINSLCSCTQLTKNSSALNENCDIPDQISVTEFFSSCLDTATTPLPPGFSIRILYEKLMR